MNSSALNKNLRLQLEQKIQNTQNPVVVFDLDGTLFDVTYRTMEIVRRFCNLPQTKKFGSLVTALERLEYKDFLYSLEATLNAAGVERYSEHSAHFMKEAVDFWFSHFFTDELVSFDRPYIGAQECVQWFYEQNVSVVYLSGRDIPNMIKGTTDSLEKYGFPHQGHKVGIVLKPAYGQDDLLFKKQAMESIKDLGNVVATFDNEPANVAMFAKYHADAINIHFYTHFAREVPLDFSSVSVIRSFEEIGFHKKPTH